MLSVRRFIADIQAQFTAFVTVLGGIRNRDLDLIKVQLKEISVQATSTRRDVLFAQVGRAITAWSKMEEVLVAIATHLLRIHPQKAGLMMYSILNFNSWLSVIHDLFELDDELSPFQDRFDKIAERIKRVKDQRDQIAHHSVDMRTETDGPQIKSSRYDARSKSIKQKPITLEQASGFTDTVLAIADDLQKLSEAMMVAREASRKKSAVPQSDQ